MNQPNQENIKNPLYPSGAVHFVLSHSYFVFLLAIVAGISLQIVFPIAIFSNGIFSYVGFVMIVLGSLLIYWAQSSSHNSEIIMRTNNTPRVFDHGPYKYSRNPTHIGLSLMTLGLGVVLNSFFIFVFLIIASIISKFIFLKKEEALLEKKYGEPYCLYKQKVRTWV